MLKTNKIVSLILVVVMALSMFVIPASALDGEKNEIIVDGISYPVIVGETYTYTFVLNVSDITAHTKKPGYLMNMEASTYYDDSKLEVQNYDNPDLLGDMDDEGEDMFPVLWTKGLIANKLDDEVTYNASAVPNGIKFNSDSSVLFKGVFKVIAEGSSEINTFIKNSQNIDLEIVIERGEFKGDAWKTIETLEGKFDPVPTEPEPTEPEPTEPEPTEPEPTEPEPTEPFNPADHTWTAVGAIAPGHSDGGIFGTAWDQKNADNDLVLDEATGIWSKTYTDVPATGETDDYDDTWYEYKVAADHDWALSFNENGDALGDGTNAKFDVEVDGSTVTICFDGTRCWAEVEAPDVTPTEPEPTEPEPTDPEPTNGDNDDLFVRVDGQLHPVTKGKTYTYTYYLTVPQAIRALDATTWYDTDGLDVVPALDADGEEDYAAMFPNFPSSLIANITGVDGEILYNFSHLAGVDFTTEKVAFTVNFLVTAEEGIYDINTQVKTLADTDMVVYIDNFESKLDTWSDREEFNGDIPPVDPTEPEPTEPEPTEPEPTEPQPTEPQPTEPEPTEPEPTEPEPTEPQPTEPAPDTFIRTESGLFPVEKGEKYTYIFYLASDAKISSIDATTYYDTTGLKFIPAVDEDGEQTGAELPNLKSPIFNYGVDGEAIFNFSNYKGVDFPIPADGEYTEDNIVFAGEFEVIGEPGVYDLYTAIKVLGGAPNVKIIYNFEKVNDDVTVMTKGIIDGIDPVDDDIIPTEPTEPQPTEPEPTEPQPTEPQPTEPQPTEPTEVKPTETTGSTDSTDATEGGTQAPSAAKPTTSSSAQQNKPTNNSSVKTGSTEAAIAFITVLVMAAGVVMFARKKKFD